MCLSVRYLGRMPTSPLADAPRVHGTPAPPHGAGESSLGADVRSLRSRTVGPPGKLRASASYRGVVGSTCPLGTVAPRAARVILQRWVRLLFFKRGIKT